MIAVFAALEAEAQSVLRSAVSSRAGQVGQVPVTYADFGGLSALVCCTGIGRRAAEGAAAILSRYPAGAVISVGFAGGLAPRLKAGHLVICDRIYLSTSAGRSENMEPLTSDAELLASARRATEAAGLAAYTGCSLTVDRVIAGPEEKRALRQRTGHDVVEMEGYWLGEVARDRGIPFLAARVVSDEAEDFLPEFVIEISGLVDSDGAIDYSRVLPRLEEHPEDIPVLARLAQRWQSAAASLARFAEVFMASPELRQAAEATQSRLAQ